MLAQLHDALLQRAGVHQSVHGHRALLAPAVRTPAGLVFDDRVPPRIGDHHVVGHREVQAEAAGLEADEEQRAFAGLEGCHAPRALGRRGGAVKVLVGNASGLQRLAQQRQEVHELAEHQRLVAVGGQFGREFAEKACTLAPGWPQPGLTRRGCRRRGAAG